MSYKELNFDAQNVTFAMSEVKEMFLMHFERGSQYVVKRIYEKILAVDFDSLVNASRYERSPKRRGHRNGYRSRGLLTSVGHLDLQVPRDREGRFQPALFERYERTDRSLVAMIREMFLRGVSTEKVGDVLEALCGERVSASYVSTVTKELDQAVRAYLNRPLNDDYVFLFLDALTVSIRFELHVKRVKLLVAYGVKVDGTRELIAFQRANSESTACWKAFVENLHMRGLKGQSLHLITMDGSAGLWAAVEEVYPLVKRQLCWVHKLRNIATCCPKKYRQECVSQATRIMYAPSAGVAAKRFRQWKRTWQKLIPKAVACLERDFDKVIPIFEFPEPVRKMIRTTNVIERCFREVRRRLKVMGYFQNSKSCDRIIYAIFTYHNNKWQRHKEKIKTIKLVTYEAA